MDLELTRIFVKVVQNGSFSKAADLLKLPKSTVSKSISRLENETGTKLLTRTTRSLTLTASGRAFYDSSLGPIQILEDAQKSLYGSDSLISGLVRITAPEDLGSQLLAPKLAELTLKHESLRFELRYTDEVLDLVKDGIDLAVRIGKPSESSFKIKKAGEITLITVASPKYLKNRDRLKHPKDLADHSTLTYSDQAFRKWSLRSDQSTATVSIEPKISSNQMTSLIASAVSGGGIALVPSYLCKKEIAAGRLVHVLPEWRSPGLPVSVITPLAPSSSARLKVTVDYLLEALKGELEH